MAEIDLRKWANELLNADSPRARIAAAKKLGEYKTINPEAISYLVDAYQNDADENVRAAAAKVLSKYKGMAQGGQVSLDDAFGDAPPPALRNMTLLRNVLIGTLALTATLNLILFVAGTSGAPQPTPTAVISLPAAPRLEVVERLAANLAGLEARSQALRQQFVDLQVDVETLNRLPKCQPPQAVMPLPALPPQDSAAHPDLAALDGAITAFRDKVIALNGTYDGLCGLQNLDDLKRRLTTDGGAAAYVTRVDSLIQEAAGLRSSLEAARLLQPSATPAPPVAAAPTNTSPFGVTVGPSNAGPSNIGPSDTGSSTATAAPIQLTATGGERAAPPTAIAGSSAAYVGFRIGLLGRYRYTLALSYESSTAGARGRGTLNLEAVSSRSPATARYAVTLSESGGGGVFAGWGVPTALLRPGQSVYTLLNGALYQTGSGGCTAQTATESALLPFNALDPDGLIAALVPADVLSVLTPIGTQGGNTQLSTTGSRTTPDGVRVALTVVTSVAPNGQPVSMTITETQFAPRTFAGTYFPSRSLTLTLTENGEGVDLSTIRLDPACASVTPAP